MSFGLSKNYGQVVVSSPQVLVMSSLHRTFIIPIPKLPIFPSRVFTISFIQIFSVNLPVIIGQASITDRLYLPKFKEILLQYNFFQNKTSYFWIFLVLMERSMYSVTLLCFFICFSIISTTIISAILFQVSENFIGSCMLVKSLLLCSFILLSFLDMLYSNILCLYFC